MSEQKTESLRDAIRAGCFISSGPNAGRVRPLAAISEPAAGSDLLRYECTPDANGANVMLRRDAGAWVLYDVARARIASLEAESASKDGRIAELNSRYEARARDAEHFERRLCEVTEKLAAANEQLESTARSLQRYGEHTPSCATGDSEVHICNCGFDLALIAALAAQAGEKGGA